MKRREFITLVGGVVAWPDAAGAQTAGKVNRVGLILPTAPPSQMAGPEPVNVYAKAFLQALNGLGYVEGRNLALERRSGEGGGPERAADIAKELIREGIDVLVVGSTLDAREIMRVTS